LKSLSHGLAKLAEARTAIEQAIRGSNQAATTKPKDALEMCKQHLNTFAISARSFECFGLGQRPRHVTSYLVNVSRDSAQRRLLTALRLEGRQLRQSWEATALHIHIFARLPILVNRLKRIHEYGFHAGQSELKYGAARFIRVHPQPASMGIYNGPADRQPHS
jgi:hypothetical protein